jgi:glycosyltransferase involved in cell wall biosynthesis
MHINIISPTLNMGGGIRVLAIYADMLSKRGHQVVLISPPPRQPTLRMRIKLLIRGLPFWHRASIRSHFDDLEDDDVPDGDVVVATWWETAEWVNAMKPSKGAKVYFVQGHEVWDGLPVQRSQATYKLPMHKIAVAQWLKDVMQNEYGDSVVDVVPNSVDKAQFNAPLRGKQHVPTVGFSFATGSVKGWDILMVAIRLLREKQPNIRLLCFGSGRPSAAFPLPPDTEFHYSPPQDKIKDIYSQCDAWLMASRSEGFGLPAIEAMACRTPVVSTKTGWPEEAIKTGVNGVLVNVNDAQGLCDGLNLILSLPENDWKKMSQSAYETAMAGSWDDSCSQFEAALVNACRRAHRAEIAGEPMCL